MSIELSAPEQKALESAFEALDTASLTRDSAASLVAGLSPRDLFCRYWPIVKQILQFLAGIPVLPASAKAAIATVIAAGETVARVICH